MHGYTTAVLLYHGLHCYYYAFLRFCLWIHYYWFAWFASITVRTVGFFASCSRVLTRIMVVRIRV